MTSDSLLLYLFIQIEETRKTEKDSTSGLQKMSVSHQIGTVYCKNLVILYRDNECLAIRVWS